MILNKSGRRRGEMKEGQVLTVKMIVSVVVGGVVGLLLYLYNTLILKPKRLQSRLEKQGIRGPPPSFLVGNVPDIKRIHTQKAQSAPGTKQDDTILHDWYSNVFSHIEQWRKQYGAIFTYSTGSSQVLMVIDPEMVKQISLCTSLKLGKPGYILRERRPLFGEGIIATSGKTWLYQKKIIAPELYMDKVKGMVDLMVDSTRSMLRSWESRIDKEGGFAEIRVDDDLRSLSADIISRACFGSSFDQGKDIFLKLKTLKDLMSKSFLYIGIHGYRHLPTKINRDTWRLEKEIDSMILKVVKQRIRDGYEKDLMQMILKGAEYDGAAAMGMSPEKFMVDNCKNIYFAGHETSATSIAWALMLLAKYPEWQARVRHEVLEICKDGALPDFEMLRGMKTMTMVIQETLRLYPVAAFIARQGTEDMKFKDIIIPKDVVINIPVPTLHQLPEVWGPDAHLFKPERFSDGLLKACKVPQAYIYFGVGMRTCVGQHFAMIELKIILSLILSKFSFALSPAYRHSPAFKLTIEPGHGVKLIVRKL